MKTIYVDMDGVLTDFERRYFELFNETTRESRNGSRVRYLDHWHKLIDADQFALLPQAKDFHELVNYLNGISEARKVILTSSGGFDRHSDVQMQKLRWLCSNSITWPAIVVPGRGYKAGFATSNSFIIDDTPDVSQSFIERGAAGVIHVDGQVQTTIESIENWLKLNKKE